MTNEDKKIVADYMKWIFSEYGGEYYYIPKNGKVIYFDLNDAGLVVQEMQKRGGKGKASAFSNFVWTAHGEWLRNNKDGSQSDFIAWLFTAKNFFKAFCEWRKTK